MIWTVLDIKKVGYICHAFALCPGRESNPHGPFGPRDFLTATTFAAVIWSRQNHCNSEVWPIWITFVVRTISWPYCDLARVGVSVRNSNLINVRCIYSHTRHHSSRSLLFGKILLLYSIFSFDSLYALSTSSGPKTTWQFNPASPHFV